MNTYKKYIVILLGVFFTLLFCVASMVFVIDPYFHYHEPLPQISYKLENQRYQNDGISRNFEYNGIIIGTCMTENFMTSEFDNLFGVNGIKIPFEGASYKEINDALTRAISYNSEIEVVIRGLDSYLLDTDKDYLVYEEYPNYLYDNNILNDTAYVFNKDFLTGDFIELGLLPTLEHQKSSTFDEYSNWNDELEYGLENVLSTYQRIESKVEEAVVFDESKKQTIKENIEQNVITIAKENPDIDFYYFYPPYSVFFFDELHQLNKYEYKFDSMEYATSLILEQENIHLFSFWNEFGIETDLDNYKDSVHYSEDVNSFILERIKEGKINLLTKENYKEHFAGVETYYNMFPYEELFINKP
ncbi:MAG: hypothetical protein R3Y24_04140 [Eubacteriales bacterium]